MIEKLLAGGAAVVAGLGVAVASLSAMGRMTLAAHSWAHSISAYSAWGFSQ